MLNQVAIQLEKLEYAWNHQVLPLLEEYFYNQNDKLIELLAPFWSDVEAESIAMTDDPLSLELIRLNGEDLLFALAKLSEAH